MYISISMKDVRRMEDDGGEEKNIVTQMKTNFEGKKNLYSVVTS